jgi:hypothetical protein
VPLVGTGVIADVREDRQGPQEEARLSIGVISRAIEELTRRKRIEKTLQ